ncbi:inositol monophosphatase family protein [Streptomyces griseorubiginosus]|uniref:inositol monophosphatase family protein n=1 Tax=Streptomyces griseorubiginosus TaxID=67304 RepID=UPI0033BBAB36
MTGTHPDLAFAHRLADAADTIALQRFSSADTAWRAKSDGSPVSIADEQIEHTLRNLIQRERPDDGVLGEEFGTSGRGRRRWVIDAIDGTASFLAGEREWSTLIALEEDGAVVLGLVTAPALRRRWWAARGTGAWTQDMDPAASTTVQRVTITGASSLGEAAVGIWPPPARLSPSNLAIAARLAAAVRRTSPETDWTDATRSSSPIRKPSTGTGTCHGALLIATGQLDAFLLLGAGPWDIAALVPIIEEAGGTYAELADTPSADTASALFTNPDLHQQIINIANHKF